MDNRVRSTLRAPIAPGAQPASRTQQSQGPAFSEMLQQEQGLKISAHAAQRIQQRRIELNGADMQKLNDGAARARQKGARDTLFLMKDAAFIVNIKNSTMVTAVDSSSLKEQVFTNIDSVAIL